METTNSKPTSGDAKMSALTKSEQGLGSVRQEEPLSVVGSWIDFDREKISYGSQLYSPQYRFQISPAKTATIKYFSSLDENNPMSINDALTYVIKHHVRVLEGKKQLDPLDVILEHDRLFFVLVVHAYSGASTSLTFKKRCGNDQCKNLHDISITAYNLQFKELTEQAERWLNPKTGLFSVETKTMGNRFYRPLTLTESIELMEFLMESRREEVEIDKSFLRLAAFFMLDRKPNETMDQLYQRYMKTTSSPKELSLLLKIESAVTAEQKLEVLSDCPKCKRPFRSPISSIAGLRDIFFVHDIDDELSID